MIALRERSHGPPWSSRWRAGLWLGGALVVAGGGLALGMGALVNGYARPRLEKAYDQAHPGCELRIGHLAYGLGSRTLAGKSVTLRTGDYALKVDRLALKGVHWARVLLELSTAEESMAMATLDAEHVDLEFRRSKYLLSCSRVRVSVPGATLAATGTEVRSLIGDEARFAADPYRTTRYHLIVPECRLSGVAYAAGPQGRAFRVRSVEISGPSLDALADREKASNPRAKAPLMVNQALAAVPFPAQIGNLTINGGHVCYGERLVSRGDPGQLTFAEVEVSAAGITTRGGPNDAIRLQARGRLMDAGLLRILMTIPLATPRFSLHVSGGLGSMDITRLNAFLERAERTRITSGDLDRVTFEVQMSQGRARGQVHAVYRNLKIAMLDKRTGSEKGVVNRVATLLANAFQIRNSNPPDVPGKTKVGKVDYERKRQDTFFQVAWFSVRSGVMDAIHR